MIYELSAPSGPSIDNRTKIANIAVVKRNGRIVANDS